MMPGKSGLNPNAAPFIPSRSLLGETSKVTKKPVDVSENSEDVGKAAGYQPPKTASVEQSFENLNVSDVSYPYYAGSDTFYDGSSLAGKQSMVDDSSFLIDFLLSKFPGYSAESLVDFLNLNDGDLDDTIDLLEQFEEAPPGSSQNDDSTSGSKPSSSS